MATACTHTHNTPKNRLLSAGSENFTYDNEGQLATGYGVGYAFDYEHRLVGIGSAVQYQYDGIGNRLEAMRDGVTTRSIYDLNGNLIAEADGSNTITRYYIHGIGLMAMVTPANTTFCYHFNQIGSTVALTDMNKAMVNQYAYTPFGTIANQIETISQPFTFVGQMGVMAEPNGFSYMRARYYDPAVRRFISEDPIGFDGGDLNLYAYVGNNPIIFTDPSGLCGQSLWNYVDNAASAWSTMIDYASLTKAITPAGAAISSTSLILDKVDVASNLFPDSNAKSFFNLGLNTVQIGLTLAGGGAPVSIGVVSVYGLSRAAMQTPLISTKPDGPWFDTNKTVGSWW